MSLTAEHSSYHRMPPTECPPVPRSQRWLWIRCWQGLMPAEALPTKDREDLVWHLVQQGWTDEQVAEHTRMTTYTTALIRTRLGLIANRPPKGAAA